MSDPVRRTSDEAIALFEQLGALVHGISHEQVMNAGLNLTVNALRQLYATRDFAERAWDEMAARAKGTLMDCYDAAGRKKGIYPYHQVIRIPYVDLREK